MDTHVKTLLEKAAKQNEAHLAMQFAQAALNAAHVLQVLNQVESSALGTAKRPAKA